MPPVTAGRLGGLDSSELMRRTGLARNTIRATPPGFRTHPRRARLPASARCVWLWGVACAVPADPPGASHQSTPEIGPASVPGRLAGGRFGGDPIAPDLL